MSASIFTARRISSAVVLPGVFAGMLVFAAPASATTSSGLAGTAGVCNGVVNQMAHRGTVQPQLLKVAAKQNAAVIQQLQIKRAGLLAQTQANNTRIATARQEIAELDAAARQLEREIAEGEFRLLTLTADKATITQAITDTKTDIDNLRTERAAVVIAHTAKAAELATAQRQLDGLKDDETALDGRIASKQRDLTAAQTRLDAAEAAATAATSRLRAAQGDVDDATLALNDAISAGEDAADAVTAAETALQEAQAVLDPLVTAADAAAAAAAAAQQARVKASGELDALTTDALAANNAVTEAQGVVDAAAQDVIELETAIDAKNLEITGKEDQLEVAQAGTTTTTTTTDAAVAAELVKKRTRLAELKENQANLRENLLAEIVALEARLTTTTTTVTKDTATINRLTTELQTLNDEVAQLERDLTAAQLVSSEQQQLLQNAISKSDTVSALKDAKATEVAQLTIDAAAAEVGNSRAVAHRDAQQRIVDEAQVSYDARVVDDLAAQEQLSSARTALADAEEELRLAAVAGQIAAGELSAATAAEGQLQGEFDDLQEEMSILRGEIAAEDGRIAALELEVAELLGDLRELDGQIDEKELALKGLQADLSKVTSDIADQQITLAGLEGQLADNRDLVDVKTAQVLELQTMNAALLAEIKAIDAQIDFGGCVPVA